MKFIIAVNEAEEKADGTKGTVTFDHIETGSMCARTNKRKLREYLLARGYPRKHHKRMLKALFPDNNFGIPYKDR